MSPTVRDSQQGKEGMENGASQSRAWEEHGSGN